MVRPGKFGVKLNSPAIGVNDQRRPAFLFASPLAEGAIHVPQAIPGDSVSGIQLNNPLVRGNCFFKTVERGVNIGQAIP